MAVPVPQRCSLVLNHFAHWCAGQTPSLWKPLNIGTPFYNSSESVAHPGHCRPQLSGSPKTLQASDPTKDIPKLEEGMPRAQKLTWASSPRAKSRAEPIGAAAEELRTSGRLGGQWDGRWRFYPHAESIGLSDSTSAWGAGQGTARVWWGGARAGSGQG